MKTKEIVKEIQTKGFITEQQMNLLKRRLNNCKISFDDIKVLFDDGEGVKITPEQTEKSLTWLKDNNPFGYREEQAIKTFIEFRLSDFVDNVNYHQAEKGIHNFMPVFTIIGKESNFQYYVELGQPKIIG
jgi:hypothetical protein